MMYDDAEDDPFLSGFMEAILEAEQAARQIHQPADAAMAWAAIATAYGAVL
jgi:hypothetical protein